VEEGSYLRLIDFLHRSTLGLRVIKKKKWKDLRREDADVAGIERPEVPRTCGPTSWSGSGPSVRIKTNKAGVYCLEPVEVRSEQFDGEALFQAST